MGETGVPVSGYTWRAAGTSPLAAWTPVLVAWTVLLTDTLVSEKKDIAEQIKGPPKRAFYIQPSVRWPAGYSLTLPPPLPKLHMLVSFSM